jgi:phage gpG-like protein
VARKPFQTKITHARFVFSPFRADEMATIGGILMRSVRDRIQAGVNVNDSPSKPLTAAYAKTKGSRTGSTLRDWTNSGNTMRSLAVLSANENRAVIGFNNPIAGRIAHWNNLRERAFGVSPRDREALIAAVRATMRQSRVISVRQVAA